MNKKAIVEKMQSQIDKYGKLGLEVDIGEAKIVAISPKGMKWEGQLNSFGVWNFPAIWRELNGRIVVRFNTHPDSPSSYGLLGKFYFSIDNGKSWECTDQIKNAGQDIAMFNTKPIDISKGEQIVIAGLLA